jgi:chitinase
VDAYLYGGSQLLTGPYAYDNDQWVGYDDRHHITQKAKFIKELNLGGAMIWAIDLDDFNGICCKIKSPLLKTINRELRGYSFDLNIFCP